MSEDLDKRDKALDKWASELLRERIDEMQRAYDKLFDAYVKTRLEYSGSWGNLSQDRRREIMVAEIRAELG